MYIESGGIVHFHSRRRYIYLCGVKYIVGVRHYNIILYTMFTTLTWCQRNCVPIGYRLFECSSISANILSALRIRLGWIPRNLSLPRVKYRVHYPRKRSII